MPSDPPSAQSGVGGRTNRITAALTQQSGRTLFKVTFRDETIPILDSGSLNHWAAVGITERHKVSVLSDGISVDYRTIHYADPHAIEELERLLNRPQATPHPAAPAKGTPSPTAQGRVNSAEQEAAELVDSVKVTRDGFEFHVGFRTRFGENKTEKLERALELFQNMRLFRPHINLMKSGIRLVVTRWDGENFIEEHGIENVEHATPEEVENLIKDNLLGSSGPPAPGEQRQRGRTGRRVVRVEVIKKPHDSRLHVLFHRQNGTTEEGPLLIRPNLAKLASPDLFRPDVRISITAVSDRIIVEHDVESDGTKSRVTDTLPMVSEADAKAVEAVLNGCLRGPDDLPPPISSPASESMNRPAEVPAPAPLSPVEVQIQAEPEKAAPSEPPPTPPRAPELPAVPDVVDAHAMPPGQASAADPGQQAGLVPGGRGWIDRALRTVRSLSPAEVNEGVFAALRRRFGQPDAANDYGFPVCTVTFQGKQGNSVPLELVLAPHYLLCTYSFGYLRFGTETRVFLTRLDDFIAFPEHALRGVVELVPAGGLVFLVSNEFAEFLRKHSDRHYGMHFGDFLAPVSQLPAASDLVWPGTVEDRLFQLIASAAASYGLPVSEDTVVLDPHAAEFIGFKKVSPHGLEFRDGEEFVRCTPAGVELCESGIQVCFVAEGVILGWALDQEGRVCAIYRQESGFVPPAEAKLIRFLTEKEKGLEGDSLNVLALAAL